MSTLVVLLTPSPRELDQELAHTMVDQYDHIVLIAGRYEGIDHRVVDRCEQQYGDHFLQLSVGKYVTL
jgi:tRNA (guanine-N1)-methyltransferase